MQLTFRLVTRALRDLGAPAELQAWWRAQGGSGAESFSAALDTLFERGGPEVEMAVRATINPDA